MEKKNTYLGNDGLLHCTVCNEAVEVKFDVPVMGIVVNVRFCPQSVRGFCPEVAGFNAGTYEVPAYVL